MAACGLTELLSYILYWLLIILLPASSIRDCFYSSKFSFMYAIFWVDSSNFFPLIRWESLTRWSSKESRRPMLDRSCTKGMNSETVSRSGPGLLD